MAKYKKIHCRMYGDEKYRSLSAPQPNAQSLWVYLLTGPETTAIPGLLISGELAMAESIRWPIAGFRRCFAELSDRGMVMADWPSRVIFVPNAIRYNEPESPNVIIGWRKSFDEIPDSFLKEVAKNSMASFTKDMGIGFREAFRKAFGEVLPNQEQEQEQEQEEDPLTPASGEFDPSDLCFDFFWDAWPKHRRKTGREKCRKKWHASKLDKKSSEIEKSLEAWRQSEDWKKNNGDFIPAPIVWLNKASWEAAIETLKPQRGTTDDDPYGRNTPGPSRDEIRRMMREISEVPQ